MVADGSPVVMPVGSAAVVLSSAEEVSSVVVTAESSDAAESPEASSADAEVVAPSAEVAPVIEASEATATSLDSAWGMGRAVIPSRQWELSGTKEGLGDTADKESQDRKCGSRFHLVYVAIGLGVFIVRQ